MLVDACLTVREARSQGPCNMVNESGGLGSRPWSSPLAIVGRGTDGAVVENRGLQACLKTAERLLGIRCTRKGGAAQPLEGAHFLVTLLAPLRIDGALDLRLALLGIQEYPTLSDTTIGRRHHAEAIALLQGGHGLRVGLGEDGLGLPQRGRDSGDPLHLGLGELLEVVGAIEGTVSHQIRRARGGVEVGNVVLDDLAEFRGITAIATERLHQDRDTGLVLDDQRQHHLVEVGRWSRLEPGVMCTTCSSGASWLLDWPSTWKLVVSRW